MLFERLEELYVFLALLFNSKLTLPNLSVLKNVFIDRVVEKENFTSAIQAFIYFVDNVEQHFTDILNAASDPFNTYLTDAELDDDNQDACIAFFNMILDDEYLPTFEDCQLLTHRIFYIVRHSSVEVDRVREVIDLLREIKYLCETMPIIPVYAPSYDEHSCSCFEYEMSGDCSHTIDDEVFF